MWMLSFIPDGWLQLAILGIIATGGALYIIGLLANFFPVTYSYREPIRIAATLLIICGVYFEGSYSTEMIWRARMEEAQAKIAKAEQASTEANTKLKKVHKQKQKVVKEYITTVKERIVKDASKIDAECKVAPEAIGILNDAAKNPFTKSDVQVKDVKQ